MAESINITYRFLSTGTFGPMTPDGTGTEAAQRTFSRLIEGLKQIRINDSRVSGCVLDFRLLKLGGEGSKPENGIQCLVSVSVKIADSLQRKDAEKMHREVFTYFESLLTFTLRKHNFAIELVSNADVAPDDMKICHVIEVFRPMNMDSKTARPVFAKFGGALRIDKLANLMLRSESSLGYSVMLDLHGWTANEIALVFQGGIQSADPMSEIGSVFALGYNPQAEIGFDSRPHVDKPVVKVRFFSGTEIPRFFVAEMVECVSTDFPRTVGVHSNDPNFEEELGEIKNLEFSPKCDAKPQLGLEPVILKVYRSLAVPDITNVCPIPLEPFPGVTFKRYKTHYPLLSEISSSGIKIGRSRTESSVNYFDIRIPDVDRSRHTYVVGKTGTGKSSLFASMVMQDILEKRPCIVIDPHGELCDDLIASVPESCLSNMILIDPSKSARFGACSLNVLDVGLYEDPIERQMATDYWANVLTNMFLSLYGSEAFSPRIQEYFRMACLTLMDPNVGGTLVDVSRLFTDGVFLKECREKVGDPDAVEFWRVYDASGSREKQEIIPYFSSKLAPLTRSFMIRHFIGSKTPSLDFEGYVRTGKTVLIRLSKGELGEMGMRLIGMILMSRITSLIMSRSRVAPEERVPVNLYVDEFQNFISSDFESLLSEARKYRFGLVLAHQYLAQMNHAQFQLYAGSSRSQMLEAILGNVGSMIVFRVGAGDAKELLPHIGEPATEQDLVNLENYHFIARILNKGVVGTPMTVPAWREEWLDHAAPREELLARTAYLMEMFAVNATEG